MKTIPAFALVAVPFIAAAPSLLTGTAVAQVRDREVQLGSRIPVKIETREEKIDEVRRIQNRFAQCVIGKHREAAVRYLLWEPTGDKDDRERGKLVRKVADGNCLLTAAVGGPDGVRMQMPGDTMRYALSDALVRSELGVSPLTGLEQVAKLQHPQLDEAEYQPKPGTKVSAKKLQELAEDRSREVARIYLSQFGECAVRMDSSKARDLLMTEPTSAEEGAAFRRLVPVLGNCLDRGQSIALNKILVRGTVAYNYYRLAKAPRTAAGPQAKGAVQ